MSSTELQDQEQRIVDALEEHREDLEVLAASDTSFATRAANALEWLNDRTKEDDDA
jgi:hypothetical protein